MICLKLAHTDFDFINFRDFIKYKQGRQTAYLIYKVIERKKNKPCKQYVYKIWDKNLSYTTRHIS